MGDDLEMGGATDGPMKDPGEAETSDDDGSVAESEESTKKGGRKGKNKKSKPGSSDDKIEREHAMEAPTLHTVSKDSIVPLDLG